MVMFLILKKLCNKAFEKKLFSQNFFFKQQEYKGTGRKFQSVGSLNGEFLSSTLHLLPLNYPIFICVDQDPYSKYVKDININTSMGDKKKSWKEAIQKSYDLLLFEGKK